LLYGNAGEGVYGGAMNQSNFSVVILAAGQGTRMRSDTHKVLHPIAGRPMLMHLLSTVERLGAERGVVVVGKGREQLEAALASHGFSTALQAEQKILTESRRNIVQLGDGTKTALEALDNGGADWGMILTVAGAVVGVVGAVATGGTSLAITFALIGGGISIAGAVVAEAEVKGETVEEVITSMDDAITKLREAIADEEDILVRALSQDVDTVFANYGNLAPKRPYVADATAADLSEFQLPAGL